MREQAISLHNAFGVVLGGNGISIRSHAILPAGTYNFVRLSATHTAKQTPKQVLGNGSPAAGRTRSWKPCCIGEQFGKLSIQPSIFNAELAMRLFQIVHPS